MENQNRSVSRWRVLGFALLLAIVVCIAYGNSYSGGYVLDDARYLELDQAPELANLSNRLGAVAAGRIRSVGNLSFTLNYLLIGDEPWAFHVGNFLVHGGTALVLFDLVRRLLSAPYFQDRYSAVATELAFVVALLWAVHPLGTMAVTYLIQRYESQAALFYLLTLYCVTRSCLANDWRWAAAAIAMCGLAVGTKEVAISAPLIAIALDRAIFASCWSELLRKRGWAYAGMWMVTAYVTVKLQPAFQAGTTLHTSVTGADHVTRWEYLCTESQVITHYIRLALFPYPLCFDYEWPIARHFTDYFATGLFIVGLLIATGYALWRWPPIGVVGLLFFCVLAPSSSFVPIADPAFEYRMYLPLACIVLLGVIGGYELWRRSSAAANRSLRHLPIVLTSIVAILFVGMTLQRNRVYRSAETVWRSVVELRPDHVRAHHNLAKILKDDGRISEAIAILGNSRARIVARSGSTAAIDIELGEIAARTEDFAEAQHRFRLAIDKLSKQKSPTSETLRLDAEAHIGLGALLQQQGDHAGAAEALIAATQRRPDCYPQAHGMAGVSLRELGKLDEAERQLDKAVMLTGPSQPWRRELGIVYFQQGRLREAADAFENWRKQAPDDLEITLRLAWLRAAASPGEVRNLAEAKQLTESLIARLGPQQQLLDLAATILAAEGKYAEATQLCQNAIAQQRQKGGDPGPMESRLQLFQNQRPFQSAQPDELY
ncbi:tetratricopeptide repeat protein [Blastopirellula sp. J2-11]|uniref:tetratricopeptide repeat protein n=1 Tax=Blastopirellula sp. J2-11 TaxID=2943192 RepID=UPI0021C743EF|nr:tetratricopeptide repeat protein [Blastopirellula sp. J2-11]UUO08088.1 tetratricopeptide repeat protein [Blastopirellula sp. J2-11]